MKKLIGILAVIILLSSCGSGNYLPCPAYGKSNTAGNPYSCQR